MARRSKALVVAMISALLLAGATVAAPSASALNSRLVYGVSPYCNGATASGCTADDYGLQAFDANSGGLAGPGKIIDVTSGPQNTNTVQNAQGLAVDPTTGDAWAVLRFGDFGSQVRYLAQIDLATGNATTIERLLDTANKAQRIASITFSDTGTLYALSGDGNNIGTSDCPACLYTVNTATAQLTKVAELGTTSTRGEAIAFNTDDGLLYHASGNSSEPQVFETVDPSNAFAVTPIGLSGDDVDEITGMTYDPQEAAFIVTSYDEVSRIATNGSVTNLPSLPSGTYLRGLAIVDPQSSVAIDDEFFVPVDSTNNQLDVLANDIAGTMNPALVVQSASDPAHGTATVPMTGDHVTYTPDDDYCTTAGGGPDTFTYTLTSGATATVRVNIGCPSFDETITLKYAKTSHTFKGDITSGSPDCVEGRWIDIFKTTTTGDTQLVSALTDAAGHYEAVFKVKSGKFFARLYSTNVPGVGFCNGADSPTIKVRK